MAKLGSTSVDEKLRQASDFLKAGKKKEARQLLREVLSRDGNNLPAWELLRQAVYNPQEEIICLERILLINPGHTMARNRLAVLKNTGPGTQNLESEPLRTEPFVFTSSQPSANGNSQSRPARRKKNRQSAWLLLLLGFLLAMVCICVSGFSLFRAGYVPYIFSSNLTATAISEKNASCQALIKKAMQASANYCGKTGSNTVCYGNNTLKAELAPQVTQRFSERGDIVGVNELQRLSASPLNVHNNEWGIAVFKVIANLPRSQPGETITMVVFGNTSLDNKSGTLESFYFSSELGQIVCEKVPNDGLMITAPDGGGVRFTVNGSDLTLMGTASLKAVKNGQMEVSMFNGSGRIVSNGQEQYFGAGQKVTVDLGGQNGNESVGPPSSPSPLSPQDLNTACAMTGQFCTPDQIQPVSPQQAQQQVQSELGITPTATTTNLPPPASTFTRTPTRTVTPTPTITQTATRTSSPTVTPTGTILVIPSWTLSKTPTPRPTASRTPAPSRTPTRTPTKTFTPSHTPTSTLTITNTPTVTFTPTASFTPTNTPTVTDTSVPTDTPVPTATPAPPSDPMCGAVSLSALSIPGGDQTLHMSITNTTGGVITINSIYLIWNKDAPSQKVRKFILNGNDIFSGADPDSPSMLTSELPWSGTLTDRQIADSTTAPLLVDFQNDLASTGFEIHIVFDIGCQVSGTK
jgi:hypothetical protein